MLKRFSIKPVSPAQVEKTCESIRLSVSFRTLWRSRTRHESRRVFYFHGVPASAKASGKSYGEWHLGVRVANEREIILNARKISGISISMNRLYFLFSVAYVSWLIIGSKAIIFSWEININNRTCEIIRFIRAWNRDEVLSRYLKLLPPLFPPNVNLDLVKMCWWCLRIFLPDNNWQ